MVLGPVSVVLLALALSLDSLSVGLLYGVRGIKLSWGAMGIVSLATGILLGTAMFGGSLAARWLSPQAAQHLGAVVLAGVGAWVVFQTWRSHRGGEAAAASAPALSVLETPAAQPEDEQPRRVWRLRLGPVGIVVEILQEPGSADLDHSGHISMTEACFLGVALAMDSVAAGLGAAMAGYPPAGLTMAASGSSFLLMWAGSRGALLLPFSLEGRWGMVHGLVLFFLGVYRMVA